jgi:uncharacterized membrane protein
MRMFQVIVESLGLFLSGILAGEEFIVRYGVQPALNRLEDRAHLLGRIALVRSLMIVVPSIMIPTVIVAIVALATAGTGAGFVFRLLGVIALVAFVLFSFLGTVPINIRVNDTWNADNPPADWKQLAKRWEFIDTFRSSAALLAFAFFVIGIALQLPQG